MPELTEVRSGSYADSVSLMQVSAAVRATAGVTDCVVAMATPLNVELLDGLGFTFDAELGPNELAVAIRADDDDALVRGRDALDAAFAELAARSKGGGDFSDAVPHRTTGAAAGEADLALISVPGPSAFVEAMDALDHGLSVMVFSDNVPVEAEIALKDAAASRGLLLMGPDCGTAVVSGVALGFANVVRAGSVGLVAASGTGAQQVMCLLDAAGIGISHCLGTGGRDLSAAVGGRATKQALLALDADPATETIVVVSKPPAPEVLASVKELAASLSTPVHWATLSPDTPSLTDAVESVLGTTPEWPALVHDGGYSTGSLRGLFCGGTLADEAMLLIGQARGPVRSNIPLSPDLALGPDLLSDGDLVIDFGDDRLTQGRPHPMIDPSLRLERIAVEAADESCGVLLLDLVLGYGAHPDPAGELASAIAAARAVRPLAVVVSVIGSAGDPQGFDAARTTLHAAGASVFVSNAQATRHALSLLEDRS